MNWGNIGWWIIYACLAIIGQGMFPGLDLLLPGFILAVQERNGVQLAWVFAFFLLLQEGLGSLSFGGSLLWYGLAIIMFYLGYALFEVESFLFIFLLCGCLGATHIGIGYLLSHLQDIPLDMNTLAEESVLQALVTPFIWRVIHPTRRLVRHDEDSV